MTLRDELLNDPLSLGYSAFIPDCPGILADMLNAQVYSMVKPFFVSARGVLAAHGSVGAAILDKLEAASTAVSEIKWAMSFLMSESGIDVGHPQTQSLLDALAAGSVLTSTESELIKAMAMQPASRAEVLGFDYVREADIRNALA